MRRRLKGGRLKTRGKGWFVANVNVNKHGRVDLPLSLSYQIQQVRPWHKSWREEGSRSRSIPQGSRKQKEGEQDHHPWSNSRSHLPKGGSQLIDGLRGRGYSLSICTMNPAEVPDLVVVLSNGRGIGDQTEPKSTSMVILQARRRPLREEKWKHIFGTYRTWKEQRVCRQCRGSCKHGWDQLSQEEGRQRWNPFTPLYT